MKISEKIERKLENILPLLIGVFIIIIGLGHILNSALLLTQMPIEFLDNVEPYFTISNSYDDIGVILGIFFGFCLVILGKGLCEKKSKTWYIVVLILIISCINNLCSGVVHETNYISILLLIILLMFRRLFKVKDDFNLGYHHLLAWVSISLALLYGILGSYLLKKDFTNMHSIMDAVYFTMVTYSTVGFGDIIPHTYQAKLFTTSMILVGLGSFATTFTFLIGPMIENRVKGVLNIMKRINNMKDHIILCGYTPLSKALIEHFEEKNIPFVIVVNTAEQRTEINEKYTVVSGSAFQNDTFRNAGINNAKAVISTFLNDSDNILTILTVKEVLSDLKNTKIRLISRIDDEENIDKAKKLGVSEIVSPTAMAASFILNTSI